MSALDRDGAETRGCLRTQLLPLLLLPLLVAAACGAEPREGDIAIVDGRVMDPASGMDAVRNVLIQDDQVVAVTDEEVDADRVIDASGLVVAPGFVDILARMRPDETAYRHKVKDGVTTVVSMHGGPVETAEWYGEFEGTDPLVNYGTTVGHRRLREAAGQEDRYAAATAEQVEEMRRIAAQSIEEGAVGIGFGINYTPGAPYMEVVELFDVAAEHDVPAHVHSRHKGSIFPGDIILSVQEVIAAAAVTGAQAQVVHLASSAIGSMEEALRLLEGAQENGVDVMADLHVYTGNRTSIESALYDEGWEERHGGVTVDSVYIPAIDRRLESEEEFQEWRERGGPVSVFHIPYDEIVMALQHPLAFVTSDGITTSSMSHPRGAGTFARLFGRFVREEGHVDLMDALEMSTVMPAERLETAVPDMARRGRLQEGSYADIVVFDPETIIDHATFSDGAQYSEGVHYLLVNGEPVLEDEEFVEGAGPGREIRRPSPGAVAEE